MSGYSVTEATRFHAYQSRSQDFPLNLPLDMLPEQVEIWPAAGSLDLYSAAGILRVSGGSEDYLTENILQMVAESEGCYSDSVGSLLELTVPLDPD